MHSNPRRAPAGEYLRLVKRQPSSAECLPPSGPRILPPNLRPSFVENKKEISFVKGRPVWGWGAPGEAMHSGTRRLR